MSLEPRVPLAACLLFAAAMFPISAAAAQGGQNGAIVLELPTVTRSLAMGGIGTATESGDAAIFFNPARLSSTGNSASASVQRYIAGSTLAAASTAFNLRGGSIAIGLQLLDYGSIAEIEPDPILGGEFGRPTGNSVSASEYALTAGYARALGRLSVGGAVKYVHQQLVDESGRSSAMDAGVSLNAGRSITVAAAVRNLGNGVSLAGKMSPLPRQVRVGAAAPVISRELFRLMAGADVFVTRGYDPVPAVGSEFEYDVRENLVLVARAGYTHRRSDDAVLPVNFGGAIRSASLSVEYAYQSFEHIAEATHRIGVRWRR